MRIALVHPRSATHRIGETNGPWRALSRRLVERGHDTDVVALDLQESSLEEILDGYRRFHELDVSAFDLVITSKYPAWMVRHDNQLLYLSHRMRSLYDDYPAALGSLEDTDHGRKILHTLQPHAGQAGDLLSATLELLDSLDPEDPMAAHPGPLAQWVVRTLDDGAFAGTGVRLLAATSEHSASRPGYVPEDRSVMVVRPETPIPVHVSSAPARSRFFAVSRDDSMQRLDLVINAFQLFPDPGAVLRIGSDSPVPPRLEIAVAHDQRIEVLGELSDEQLADEYASATAVVFAPDRDDSGLVSIEAMRSGTPVITTNDSGGARELIEHGINGMVVEPTPERLAWAMRHVAGNPHVRWQLALNARRSAAGIDWTPLLDEVEELAAPAARPAVLVLSTYSVDPMIGGGQRRVRHLLRSLARWADVTLLVSSAQVNGIRRRRIEPGIDQVEVGRTSAQRRAEHDLYFALGQVPVDDVIAARLTAATPAFGHELDEQLLRTDALICAQPFLAALIGDVDVPVIHDSQNVEAKLKQQLFAQHGELGRWLTDQVVTVEAQATERANLLVACTPSDLHDLLSAVDHRDVASMVVDNGVDTQALPMRQVEERRPARAEVLTAVGRPDTDDRPLGLFIGSWHPPNVEAARLVFDVARRRPDWIFVLAGSHTSEFAGEDLPSNVSLIAIFAEPFLWPLMAAADVALNPMVSGGGSNLKVYDYLAVGVPVLTTDIGARGLGDADDLVTRVEPTPEALAAALDDVAALGRSEAGTAVMARGRAAVEERFEWDRLGERWARAVLGQIDGPLPSERPVTRRANRPTLADTAPPPSDPVEATMETLGAVARSGPPTPLDITMDPTIREHLKFATEHRFVGQRLPDRTRMKPLKQLLIRAGKALSNEQVHYNEALLEAAETMAKQLHHNEMEIQRLRDEVTLLRAQRSDEVPQP